MRDRVALIIVFVIISILCIGQGLAHARGGRPPGIPNYTHPYGAQNRAAAAARVWEVYAAIDAATEDPQLRAELRRICRRESACNWIREINWHRGDASGGRERWKKAVARGLLHPDTCAAHEEGDASRWTSYGPFGIASAWTVHYVGECEGPAVLDDPYVAAAAAVSWMDTLCRRHKACTCEGRIRWWVGPGRWAKRPALRNLKSVKSQCGEQPWWEYVGAAWEDYAQPTIGAVVSYIVRETHVFT